MPEIRLPSLGAEMEEGTLLEWFVKPGDRVEYGQIVALLDTEKAEIEMESFETGQVEALLVQPGETISVGTPMARLQSTTDTPSEPSSPRAVRPAIPPDPPAQPAPSPPPPPPPPRPESAPPIAEPGRARVRATPLARRIAAERGIALELLSGSGPHGAIVEADVEGASPGSHTGDAPTSTATPNVGSVTDRGARRRRIIAAAMERSKREIPHYYLSTSIEVEPAHAWLERENRERPVARRLLFPALLVKAVALAARRFPQLNGHWVDGAHRPADAVHLGMVVSLRGGGVIVPTIRNADSRTLDDIMDELRDVVTRARSGRLRTRELGDATLTLTSLGDGGVETIYGVIYPPQVAILGFGAIHREPRAAGDLLGTGSVLRATLAADHRASDGQEGSRFLMTIARLLSDPEALGS